MPVKNRPKEYYGRLRTLAASSWQGLRCQQGSYGLVTSCQTRENKSALGPLRPTYAYHKTQTPSSIKPFELQLCLLPRKATIQRASEVVERLIRRAPRAFGFSSRSSDLRSTRFPIAPWPAYFLSSADPRTACPCDVWASGLLVGVRFNVERNAPKYYGQEASGMTPIISGHPICNALFGVLKLRRLELSSSNLTKYAYREIGTEVKGDYQEEGSRTRPGGRRLGPDQARL